MRTGRRRGRLKAAVRRKEGAWKRVLAGSDEENKERCLVLGGWIDSRMHG